MRALLHFIRLLHGFAGNRSGNVIVIVAFSALPLVGVVGLVTDYSLMLSVKAKLDHAVDAATVAGITSAQRYITNFTGVGDPTLAAVAVGQAQAMAQFKANTGTLPGGTLQVTNLQVVSLGQTLLGNASYSFSMPTVFMRTLGKQTMTFSGKSSSSLTMPGYTNIYVIIDISSSMGIGATVSDQQIVYNTTGGCAVACHYSGTTTTARNAGATLRIDVAKQAVVAALNQMQNSGTSGQYKVAIYTMSDEIVNVYPLSSDLNGAISAVNTIDLSTANYDGGTDTSYALSQLNSQLPIPGTGLTSATAQGNVMLITDGVQDSDMKYYSHGSLVDGSDSNFSVYSPCSAANCQYFSSFGIYVESFDSSKCTPLKIKGYKLMTLNVQYLVPPSNLQSSSSSLNAVFSYIQNNLLQSIPSNMTACATSSSNAYSANTPSEINTAVESMFASVGALARITQ